MRERATVTDVREGSVDVAIVPSAACVSCGMCAEERGVRVLAGVMDGLGARVGDVVEIETPARARRRAEGLVYIAPVVAILGGYLAGFLLFQGGDVNPDAAGAVIGIIAGALTLLAVRFAGRTAEGDTRYGPRVRVIIARGETRRQADAPPAVTPPR